MEIIANPIGEKGEKYEELLKKACRILQVESKKEAPAEEVKK